MSFVV